MISIVYLTNRKENLFHWFAQSILRQDIDNYEIIVVDFWLNKDRETYYESLIPTSIPLKCIKPLPSPIQGDCRVTSQNYFSASNARNTGLVYAKGDYIMYVDDLSVLSAEWGIGVSEAANGRYILEGAYRKDKGMAVEDGVQISGEPSGIDSRWGQCGDGKQRGNSSWLFGCSVGMPIDIACEVNGWDCMCDILGYEDSQMGERLQKLGVQFIYDKRVLTIESEEHHFLDGNYFVRFDPAVDTWEQYLSVLNKFRLSTTTFNNFVRYDASHILIDCVKQKGHRAYGNNFDIHELRNKVKAGTEITMEDMKFATHFWFDGKPLTEM